MSNMPIFAFILLGIMLFAFAAIYFLFFLIDHRDKLYTFDDDAVMNSDSFVNVSSGEWAAQNTSTPA